MAQGRTPELRMRWHSRRVWYGAALARGHWDVELVQLIDGRATLLATLSLDEWIDLGATQYVLELQQEGEQLLKPAGGAIG